MKRPIAWHKERLKNQRDYYARERANLERRLRQTQDDLQGIQDEELAACRLEEQIRRAEAEGRDGFDAEKFNKRRV